MTLIKFKVPTTIEVCVGTDKENEPVFNKREFNAGDEEDVTIFEDSNDVTIGVDFNDGSNSFLRKDIVEIEGIDFPWQV